MGRPKLANKKIRFVFLIDPEHYKIIDDISHKLKVGKSELLRGVIRENIDKIKKFTKSTFSIRK